MTKVTEKESVWKTEFKSISEPKGRSGWMDVEVTLSGEGVEPMIFKVSTNGFGHTALIGRNQIREIRTFISIWDGTLDGRLREWAKVIVDAHKIVSANSKHWKELV